MARGKGRSGRRYVRDNRGRFASKGAGATARGGRLKTASGKKRATQTMKASGAKPSGAIKGRVKRDPAAASRVGQSGAAKPAATTKLKRSGAKAKVGSTKNNLERGRRGVVSMSPAAKAARRGNVAERRSERLQRITERQSGIVARRQINRASNYNPDGTFNQSAANANQRRLKRSQQLQERLRTAATGPAIASGALTRKKPASTAAKPASVNPGKPAQVTSRGRTIKPAQNFKPAVPGKSAPDNARTRANKLKTAQNKVRMYSETSSRSSQNAIANRNAALKARPQGTPGKVVFRSKNRASSRFQQRANDLTSRIKGDLKASKTGTFSATGGGGGKGIVRRNTGDKQTSMFGKPAPLYTNKTAKSVKRRSGKRK